MYLAWPYCVVRMFVWSLCVVSGCGGFAVVLGSAWLWHGGGSVGVAPVCPQCVPMSPSHVSSVCFCVPDTSLTRFCLSFSCVPVSRCVMSMTCLCVCHLLLACPQRVPLSVTCPYVTLSRLPAVSLRHPVVFLIHNMSLVCYPGFISDMFPTCPRVPDAPSCVANMSHVPDMSLCPHPESPTYPLCFRCPYVTLCRVPHVFYVPDVSLTCP